MHRVPKVHRGDEGAAGTKMSHVACRLVIVLAYAVPAFAQRLPANVTPTHYDLSVTPDLENATFGGSERIEVTLKAPARTITLNAAEIQFDTATISAGGRTQRARVTRVPSRDQATLTVPRLIPAGAAEIEINYRGILNDQLRGLYLSKANNRRYAVTQLEATDARRMFPSFDEPAFKATFSLSATIDEGDHAISNGAVVSDTPGPGARKHTVRFETTPKMSTYLVALAVGDLSRAPPTALQSGSARRRTKRGRPASRSKPPKRSSAITTATTR